jgi:hypothetical protein
MTKKFSRRFVTFVLAFAFVFSVIGMTFAPSEALADDYYNYLYPYTRQGTVLCRQLNVRVSPKTSAKSYGKLKNGQTCTIVGQYNDWIMVDLNSCGLSGDGQSFGFVKYGLIEFDPGWIVLTQYTNLYATPWQTFNYKNGEQSGRVLLVIEQNYGYYAVQCCESTPGTSFIYAGDVGQYSQYGQNLYVVAEDKVPVYDAPWGRQISTLDRFTIVDVAYGGYGNTGIQQYPFETYDECYENDGFTYVTVNYGQENAYGGYINSQYLQKIIN